MVTKGLRAFGLIVLAVSLFWHWSSLMHNLARVYEHMFIAVNYEYVGLADPNYHKEVSWKEKIVCVKEYATPEVMEFLHCVEESQDKKVIWHHRGKLTEEATVANKHFVVKSAELCGFFKNIFYMSMGVNVWNNAHWAKDLGIPVLKPVAFIEKRTLSKTKSFIVYVYEGKVCEKELKRRGDFFSKVQELETLLCQKGVIHHDFRLRNMVILEDDTVQFIDIDKLHWYPHRSYVFHERMKREVRKFNTNLKDHDLSKERLVV